MPNGLLRQNCRRGWPISLAVSFTATAGWCPSSGSRRGRAQLLFPRTWWEWDIELDLREQQHRLARGDVIATGTIAAEGYGQCPRDRAAFIVNTIRDHLRHKRTAEAARKGYAYRIDGHRRTTKSLGRSPSLPRCPGWRPPTARRCARGIIGVVEQIVADDRDTDSGRLVDVRDLCCPGGCSLIDS